MAGGQCVGVTCGSWAWVMDGNSKAENQPIKDGQAVGLEDTPARSEPWASPDSKAQQPVCRSPVHHEAQEGAQKVLLQRIRCLELEGHAGAVHRLLYESVLLHSSMVQGGFMGRHLPAGPRSGGTAASCSLHRCPGPEPLKRPKYAWAQTGLA